MWAPAGSCPRLSGRDQTAQPTDPAPPQHTPTECYWTTAQLQTAACSPAYLRTRQVECVQVRLAVQAWPSGGHGQRVPEGLRPGVGNSGRALRSHTRTTCCRTQAQVAWWCVCCSALDTRKAVLRMSRLPACCPCPPARGMHKFCTQARTPVMCVRTQRMSSRPAPPYAPPLCHSEPCAGQMTGAPWTWVTQMHTQCE